MNRSQGHRASRLLCAGMAFAFAMSAPYGDAAPTPSAGADTKGVVLDWKVTDGDPKTYVLSGQKLTLSARATSDGPAPVLMVKQAGNGEAAVQGVVGFPKASATMLVQKLDPDSDGAAVLFMTYSGGAHCCVQFDVLDPLGVGWTHIDIGSWDVDPLSKPVEDLNGDGVPDIVLPDDRFDYVFASFAGSWAPPVVFNVRGGKLKNVSDTRAKSVRVES